MGLFDRRRLPATVITDLRAAYPGKVLAWAHGFDDHDEQWLIGQAGRLLLGRVGAWTVIGWHEIARGGWEQEDNRLRWTQYDGARQAVRLDDLGSFPELFRERVQASIVLQQHVTVPNDPGDGLMIAARRDLHDTTAEVQWHVSLGKGTTWRTPGARETGELVLEQLRTEYERG